MDCLDCSKYLTCRDKKKAKNYRCEEFSKKTLRDISEILSISSVLDEHGNDEIDMSDVEGENKKKRDPGFILADEKTNVSELIESVINSDLLTPIDTKIDDSAAPSAKNFYEFTTGQHFLNVKPYAFQMLYITQLFAEYCPRCSDTKWMREGIKVDDSLALFYEKVKLLEFGVCPKCGATKSHLVKEGELNFYQELAGLAGQRCIAGESVIFTDAGMVHVDELDNGLDFEFNEVESFILNGDFDIVPNHAIYKCYPEESYRVELENGMWIEGTKEHPIYTANGYVPIIMSEGELVPVRFDFEAFGKERLPLNIAKFLGYWIACGSTCSLQTTNADAFEAVKALFPQAFKIEDQIIFDYSHSFSRMSELLGYSPNYVEDRRYVPKNVRSADRASVLVFLQAFFAEASVVSNNVITVVCKSKRIQLSIASYLQMFGVRYLIKGQNIEIDGESNQFFTRTFNLPRVGNTISEYDSYEYDEEEDVYWIPVKSISRSFFQVTYDFVVPGTHDFVANGFIQHNSGKSAITAMSCAYLLHKQLKLQKPNEVYGLLPANVLHGTFVALTYKQAAETLWEPFLAYVTDSPWFNLYHDILDHYNKKYNDEFYKVKDTFITYKARRLLLYPAGPNKKTLRGRTRFLSCLTGDSLVSTNHGLVPLREPSLVGMTTHRGNSERRIINHKLTGVRDTWKVKLKNGLSLKSTNCHQFLCLNNDSTDLVWKRQDEIRIGDSVAVSLGGSFPDALPLNFIYSRAERKDDAMLDYMLQHASGFTLNDVSTYSGKTYRGVTAVISQINSAFPNALSRVRVGRNSPYTYSVANSDEITAFQSGFDSGKVNALRKDLRFPQSMTTALAYMIGYLIADGNYAQNGSEISFTSTSKKKMDHFFSCFVECFNVHPRISSWETDSGKTAYNVVFALQPVKDFFVYLGLAPAWSSIKVLPWSILQAPRDCVAACLSAMISCDGSINGQRLSYSSRSKKLIRQVQLSFLRLGYACSIKLGNISKVKLTAYDRDRFLEKDYTGLTKRSYHSKARLSDCEHSSSHVNYTIPGAKSVNANRTWEHCNVFTRSDMNSRCQNTSNYKNLIDKDLIFSTVVSMVYAGKKKVYDIAVDSEDHTFTANGISVHNCIDEIGWFDNNRDEGKVKMDANEVYVALDRSLLTVRSSANRLIRQGFDDIPNGYAFNVSSPSSARDKIVELVTQSRNSRKILGFKRATWEMNPNITKDDLSEEFAKDPQAAERDYGCNPPLSDNAFFSSFAAIEGCFVGKPNKLKYSYAQRKAKDGSITRYAKIDEVSKSTKPNVLAIDSGYTNNSFSLVCGHLHEGIPILTCFCEVMPNPGMPLNHALIFRELIFPLIKERNVKVLISDRWQNIKLLQDAEMEYEDLITISYSLKYDDFWVIKQSMFDSEIVFPKLKRSIDDILKYDQSKYPFCFTDPIEHLALQVMTVRDMGNTVDKGDSLTDDTFRASCLAIHALTDEELFEIFNGEGMEEVKSKAALGHMITKSSGGTGKSGEVAVSSSGKAIGVAISRR